MGSKGQCGSGAHQTTLILATGIERGLDLPLYECEAGPI